MTMMRQVQLRRGSTTLDLNTSPYDMVAGSWTSTGPQLEMRVLVQATTLAELRRYVAAVRQLLNQAQHYAEEQVGSAVYVYTKTCDDLTTTAELGATWLRKRIKAGSVMEPDASELAQGRYALTLIVSLETDDTWRRAAPANILAATGTVTARSDGGVTVAASGSLTARRIAWTAAGGVTVRVRWVYADGDVTFFQPSTSFDARALYLASDNKLYLYDCAGNVASSSALTATAGDELDLVFKWDPATPKMGIWVNGVANGNSATCVLGFGLGSELVANGGFETHTGSPDDGTSDTFTGWTETNTDASNRVEASTTKYSGTTAVKLVATGGTPAATQDINVTGNMKYTLEAYVRGDGTRDGNIKIYDITNSYSILYNGLTGVTGTSYQKITVVFTTASNTAQIMLLLGTYNHYLGGTFTTTAYYDAVSIKGLDASANVDSYALIAPTGTAQAVLGVQVWPGVLTDAQCAGLNAWGRPEPELAFYTPPTDTKTTNAAYKLYNVPGEADARLRLLLSDATQAYDKFRVGIRPLRIQTTTKWECEDGTNGTDVADAADASASGGNIAQFTPSGTSYATRSTITLAANPADMSAFYGQYRLLLAVKDNAAAIGRNILKWRLVCAGVAGDYSDEYSAAAVSTYSLLDLGTLTLPPGEWPEETESCTTDVVGGSYLTLEIQAKNTSGGGGGTLNLDAVYLQPVELEGVVECASLTTAQFLALDFASDPPAAIVVASATSLEYAAFGTYLGDELVLAPAYGDAGLLMVYAYRDTAEKAYPNDALTVYLFIRPGWL